MDLDGDGLTDLISGSWPGEIYFFKRLPNGDFAAPQKLRHQDGRVINVGGGIRKSGRMVVVVGDAEIEQTDQKTVVIYNGQRHEFPAGTPVGRTGCASAVCVADWDGDGDYDLIVGDIRGNVWLVPNEGTPKAPAFGPAEKLLVQGKPLRVASGDAGPAVADWDGDGDLDLLVGAGNGSVWLFENVGSRESPRLAAGRQIIGPGASDRPDKPRHGMRAKICVTDYNGDGLLDILLGDFCSWRPGPQSLSSEQSERVAALREKAQQKLAEYARLARQLARAKDPQARATLQEQLQKTLTEYRQISSQLPRSREYHGWVWLFLRKNP